jgi:hypothetical protein
MIALQPWPLEPDLKVVHRCKWYVKAVTLTHSDSSREPHL